MVLLKRMLFGCLAAVWLMSLCACAEGRQETSMQQESPALVFEDALGREVVVRETPRRVAVLLGSFAEMWLLAGGEGSLIAVTQDAFDERGLELGEEVVNLGESHQPSLEALFAVEPDLVILSADLDGQLALRDSLEQAEISCAWCKVELFEDYLALLRTFTELLDTPELYQKNGLDVQMQVNNALAAAPKQGTGPKVLLLRAYSSNVKAKNSDNTAGVMLRELGCVNIADSDSGLLEQLQMESIMAADPQHVFVTTMGSDTEKALQNVQALFDSDPAWRSITAVKEGRVHVLNKELFHYKPNARWGESYEILANILYPAA